VSCVLALVVAGSARQRDAIWLATLALLFDSLAWTVLSFFNAHERGDLGAVTIVAQRVMAAALGIAALAAGLGVVSVLAAFAAGTGVGFVVALALAARRIGLPSVQLSRAARKVLRRESWPFAGQELLSIGIARADTLLLAALASATVVGLYGAGYRLFESTLFIPTALTGAFSAMFAYLELDSEPSVHAVFQRALKLTLFLLVPIGMAFLVLAKPIIDAFFGDGFGGGVGPLRLLAPTAVLLGVVLVSTSLVVSRTNPRRMVWVFGIALVVNVAANLVLIPWLEASGAALSMLVTEAVFAVIVLRMASASVGRLDPRHTAAAPLVAGAVMAVPMALLGFSLWLAVPAGVATYLGAFFVAERRLAPEDLAFVRELVRRRRLT
jgi:O-antigen/teichoic acid export membrane protein